MMKLKSAASSGIGIKRAALPCAQKGAARA